jgi:hypothetical protein
MYGARLSYWCDELCTSSSKSNTLYKYKTTAVSLHNAMAGLYKKYRLLCYTCRGSEEVNESVAATTICKDYSVLSLIFYCDDLVELLQWTRYGPIPWIATSASLGPCQTRLHYRWLHQ